MKLGYNQSQQILKPGDALFNYSQHQQQQQPTSEYRHLQALRPLENKTATFENQQQFMPTHGEISIHEGLTSVEKNKRVMIGLSSARNQHNIENYEPNV